MYDILIIGGGPAGLTAAIYAARAGLSFVITEKDIMGSGAISSAEQVDNYPGLQGINGYDLGEKFSAHAKDMGAEIINGEVLSVRCEDKSFTTVFADNKTTRSKTILYAAGTRHRPLEIPGAELMGISYCAVCDGAFYGGKKVAVIGGGDTALTDALYLSKSSEEVFLIHRRSEFRANASLVKRAKENEKIRIITNAVPVKVIGEKRVSGLELLCNDEKMDIEVNGIFAAIGILPNTDILKGIVELDSGGFIIADESGKTSLPGFFAAGDVRTKALRQVVTACADGANCIDSIEKYLSDKK